MDGETVELTPPHRIGSGIRATVPDTRSAVFTSCPHLRNLTDNAANSAVPDSTHGGSEPGDLPDHTADRAAADMNGSASPNHSTNVVVERGR
jgi:hypothetical protein